MIHGLLDARVAFVVIGGVAANLHGSARITNDLDICYEPSESNRQRLAGVLASWQVYLRGVEPGLPFMMDARMLRDTPVMTLAGSEGWIDVMDRVAGVGEFAKVRAASSAARWDDTRFLVIGLDALIAAKRAAARRKDQEALLELEALREERRKRGL